MPRTRTLTAPDAALATEVRRRADSILTAYPHVAERDALRVAGKLVVLDEQKRQGDITNSGFNRASAEIFDLIGVNIRD